MMETGHNTAGLAGEQPVTESLLCPVCLLKLHGKEWETVSSLLSTEVFPCAIIDAPPNKGITVYPGLHRSLEHGEQVNVPALEGR